MRNTSSSFTNSGNSISNKSKGLIQINKYRILGTFFILFFSLFFLNNQVMAGDPKFSNSIMGGTGTVDLKLGWAAVSLEDSANPSNDKFAVSAPYSAQEIRVYSFNSVGVPQLSQTIIKPSVISAGSKYGNAMASANINGTHYIVAASAGLSSSAARVVIRNMSTGAQSIYTASLGDGTGGFESVDIASPGIVATSAPTTNSLRILNLSGTTIQTLTVPGMSGALKLRDVNGDGVVDLLVRTSVTSPAVSIKVFMGALGTNGLPTFSVTNPSNIEFISSNYGVTTSGWATTFDVVPAVGSTPATIVVAGNYGLQFINASSGVVIASYVGAFGQYFNAGIKVRDFDIDGIKDVAVGEPGRSNDVGGVLVFKGPKFNEKITSIETWTTPLAKCGQALAFANNNLIVTCPNEPLNNKAVGKVVATKYSNARASFVHLDADQPNELNSNPPNLNFINGEAVSSNSTTMSLTNTQPAYAANRYAVSISKRALNPMTQVSLRIKSVVVGNTLLLAKVAPVGPSFQLSFIDPNSNQVVGTSIIPVANNRGRIIFHLYPPTITNPNASVEVKNSLDSNIVINSTGSIMLTPSLTDSLRFEIQTTSEYGIDDIVAFSGARNYVDGDTKPEGIAESIRPGNKVSIALYAGPLSEFNIGINNQFLSDNEKIMYWTAAGFVPKYSNTLNTSDLLFESSNPAVFNAKTVPNIYILNFKTNAGSWERSEVLY